jgi:hypothetical protein
MRRYCCIIGVWADNGVSPDTGCGTTVSVYARATRGRLDAVIVGDRRRSEQARHMFVQMHAV